MRIMMVMMIMIIVIMIMVMMMMMTITMMFSPQRFRYGGTKFRLSAGSKLFASVTLCHKEKVCKATFSARSN